MIGDRVVRKYRGSQRPPDVHPDVWSKVYNAADRKAAVEEYLQKCTVANAAREVVQFAIRQLDRGLSDHYVRNAAGRLIVYGFAHGIYPGFPGSREFEWEYALSGLEALNPDNF